MPAETESVQIQSDEFHQELAEQKNCKEKLENGTSVKRKRGIVKKEKVQNYGENLLQRLVNEERVSILQKLSHNLMPGFNINVTKSKPENLSNFPLFQCTIPNCISVSSEHPNKVDLCHKRTLEHYDYMYQLNRQRGFYEIAEKKKDFKKSMKKGVYPYNVVTYAELLENNPDPYFQARFDCYYTGGNLKCNSDNNLVYHSTGNNLNKLVLSRMKKKSKTDNLKAITAMDLLPLNDMPNSEIFEIQSLALKNRFSVRQKYSLSLLTYDDNDLILDYTIFNNEVPFITSSGVDLDPVLIATGNLNKEIFLWDINNSTTIPKQKLFENKLDTIKKSRNWNCLCNLDSNMFAFTTLNEFCILDCRQSANESKNNLCTFGNYKEICENISSLAKSSYNNIIYFGTTHKLFTVDTRFMGKEISDKYILQRWTHQMESAPLILKPYSWAENYELIAMSSLLSGDIRICENFSKYKHDKQKYISPCLPFMPPSLLDGYKTAKIHGECLDPVTNLEKRINSCTTGIDFFKKDDYLYFFISNSLGDIFSTKLNFDDDIKYSDKNNIEIIVKYNEKVKMKLEKNPLPLNLTDFVQLQGMNKVFRCKRLNNVKTNLFNVHNDQEPTNLTSADDEPKRPIPKAKWQKSLTKLYAYKDVLASNLLSVWDMELTEDKDTLPVIDKNIKKHQDTVKVNEWLNQTNFLDNSLPVEDIEVEKYALTFNEINSTLKSPTQNIDLLNENETPKSHHFKPTNRREVNQNHNMEIIDDSFMADNPLKTSTQLEINPAETMEIDESIDDSKPLLKGNSDEEITPGQVPVVKKIFKPKHTERRKRNYVKGF